MAQDLESQVPGRRQELPMSVGQLNWYLKNLIENSVPSLWIEGEITDLSQPSSGHIYFSLKDANSQVRAVIWRSTAERIPFKLTDGLSVLCRASVEVYHPRGSYQLIVNQVQPKGVGPAQLALQQLQQRLAKEGLFDPGRKRALPKFPKRIGLVTSLSAAALHDFLEASRDRWSGHELIVLPARVQGESAAMEVVQALRQAHRVKPKFDLLVVCRGGGSVDDLSCFNEEQVVRAVSKCRMPVVAAIGHEVDVSLTDMVADARALTPTDAAKLVLPSRRELAERLTGLKRRVQTHVSSKLEAAKVRLAGFRERGILAKPHDLHQQRRQAIDDLEIKTQEAMQRFIESRRQQLQNCARAVGALSPLQVLARGFSLTTSAEDTTKPITGTDQVQVGQQIRTTLASGKIRSTIDEIEE